MFKHAFGALVALGLSIAPALAETYPKGPVTLVIPYSAGGLTDIVGRVVAQELHEKWGQPVVVENVTGGGSLNGAVKVAKSDPDGQTILLGSYGLITGQIMLPQSGLKPDDLAPVYKIGRTNSLLLVRKDFPADTLEEVIAYIRDNPGGMTFASSGIGSSPHIAAEVFAGQLNSEILHIPFQGTSQAMTEIVAGRVDAIFDGVTPGMQYARDGSMKAIAIAATERHPSAPEVATFNELGTDFVFGPFWGFFVTSATPEPVQQALYNDLQEVIMSDKIRAKLEEYSFAMRNPSQQEFRDFMAAGTKEIEDLVASGRLVVSK